jgi:hypothetical protein
VSAGQTSFVAPANLPPGFYWIHIAAIGPEGWSPWAGDHVFFRVAPPAAPVLTQSFRGAVVPDATPTWRWEPGAGGGEVTEYLVFPNWEPAPLRVAATTREWTAPPRRAGFYWIHVMAVGPHGSSGWVGDHLTVYVPDSLRISADLPADDAAYTPVLSPDGQRVECGDFGRRPWRFEQSKNQVSICGANAQRQSDLCSGADFVRASRSARACAWVRDRRFDVSVNASEMANLGCSETPDSGDLGGFNMFVGWDARSDDTNPQAFHVRLSELRELRIRAAVSTESFNVPGGTCANGTRAVAQSFLLLILTRVEPNSQLLPMPAGQHSIFYQVHVYDSRGGTNNAAQTDCGFPRAAGGDAPSSLVGDSIGTLGALTGGSGTTAEATVGAGARQYDLDVLPRLREIVERCVRELNLPDADLGRYWVAGYLVGNETLGNASVTNLIANPEIEMVYDFR